MPKSPTSPTLAALLAEAAKLQQSNRDEQAKLVAAYGLPTTEPKK